MVDNAVVDSTCGCVVRYLNPSQTALQYTNNQVIPFVYPDKNPPFTGLFLLIILLKYPSDGNTTFDICLFPTLSLLITVILLNRKEKFS